MTTGNEPLLPLAQVAAQIQIHETTITRWLRRGYLRGFKLGKTWRIAPSDLRDFLEERANRHPRQAGLSLVERETVSDAG